MVISAVAGSRRTIVSCLFASSGRTSTHFRRSVQRCRTRNRRRAGSSPATHRHQQSATLLPRQANHVLPQKVERHAEQDDVLHQEGNVPRHRREAACGNIPALRHEGNDGDGRDEGAGRAKGAKNAEPLVPEAREQQTAEGPLGDAEEVAGTRVAEHGIEPPDQRSVADERDQSFKLIRKPLLIAEEEEHDHHRGPDDVVVEILREQAGPMERAKKRVWRSVGNRGHGRDPFVRDLTGARSLHATAGKSISVSLMRLKTLVKTVVANARLISTNWASLYPAALIAAKSSSLTVPLDCASLRTKPTSASLLALPVG